MWATSDARWVRRPSSSSAMAPMTSSRLIRTWLTTWRACCPASGNHGRNRSSGPWTSTRAHPGWLFVAPIQLSGEHIGNLLALRRTSRFHADERASLDRVASLFALQASSDRHWHQRIQLAKVRERERLANDLHDDVVQLLYGVQLNLDLAVETTGERESERASSPFSRSRGLGRQGPAGDDPERSDPATPQLDEGMREIVRQMRLDHGLDVGYSSPRSHAESRTS